MATQISAVTAAAVEIPTLNSTLIEASAKLRFLVPVLRQLKLQGSKVLVFVEHRDAIGIMADMCNLMGFSYVTLDGCEKPKRRKRAIKKFQTRDKFLFIATTKTGGIGLNLQVADVVVLMDSSWNPQTEQAICRWINFIQRLCMKKHHS